MSIAFGQCGIADQCMSDPTCPYFIESEACQNDYQEKVEPVYSFQLAIHEIANRLRKKRGDDVTAWQAVCLAEETGEALQQFRRWQGQARSMATRDDFGAELADVVITSFVFADLAGVNLWSAIATKLDKIEERGGI